MTSLLIAVIGLIWGVEARFQADAPQDKQWAKLTIEIFNGSQQAIQNPKAAFDFLVPDGKIPVIENWYSGGIQTSLEKKSSTAWTLWMEQSGSLAAGQGWNFGNGVSLGIHLSDWSNWEPSSAPSWNGNNGTKVTNPKIRVWDATGILLWGPSGEIAPAPSMLGYSTMNVVVGSGGRCNAVGTVVLDPQDKLELRCQQGEAYQAPSIWVDGSLRPSGTNVDLTPDGRDHQVEVQFSPRPVLWHTVNTVGAGRCDPAPTARGFAGESRMIACAADNGNKISSISIDGVPVSPTPRSSLDGTKTHSLTATFEPISASTFLVVEGYRDNSASAQFSAFHLRVRNTGSVRLAAGWKASIPFRIPDYVTPIVSNWDLPAGVTSLVALGEGWYFLEIRSTTALEPGGTSGEGRGWYVALNLLNQNSSWDRLGDIAVPDGATWTSAPYIRISDASGGVIAGADVLMPSMRNALPSVEVWYKDQELSANYLRPQIILKNTGSVPLSDFVYDYHFCTEGGKQPMLDPWYTPLPKVHLEALGGFCYKVRYEFPGVTLLPGQEIPNNSGNAVGLHDKDWSNWDRSNDWSSANITSQFQKTTRIPVYDKWGNLVGGEEVPNGNSGNGPSNPEDPIEFVPTLLPPIIVLHPKSVTVNAGQQATFEARAVGDGSLTYQWRVNGLDLPGATNPVLTIGLTSSEQDGNKYTVVVTGTGGIAVSQGAILSIKLVPTTLRILAEPLDDTVELGLQARFDVVASGQGPLTWQWFRNGRILPGETSSSLVLKSQSWVDTGFKYWVRITDGAGKKIESRKAKVHVVLPPLASLRIPLEGQFEAADGIPKDTSVDLQVRLFAEPEASVPLWVEVHKAVPVVGGRWKIEFGQMAKDPSLSQLFATQPKLHLELSLGTSEPRRFLPRMPLTAVPTALRSGVALAMGHGGPLGRTDLVVGTLYLDQDLAKTWFRDSNGWRALEP